MIDILLRRRQNNPLLTGEAGVGKTAVVEGLALALIAGDAPPALRQALVLSEDKRFYEHSGVDWVAVSAAAWGNLWHSRTRGASTITMQLAGLLDEDWRQGGSGRSVVQKLGQAVAAQVLERRWRKDHILEAYLNLVPFRGELVGIDALSRTLFAKAAHGLDAREAAVAAALVRAPNARPAVVAQRACSVLRAMARSAPDCLALDMFASAALQRRAYAASEGIAPLREQIAELTGQRFLAGYTDDETQYRALMDAASGAGHWRAVVRGAAAGLLRGSEA